MSFEFDFTKEHLGEIISADADDWYDALCELLPKYGITTERRVAHFLSQCAHESAGFKRLEENLNYSAKALRAVFGQTVNACGVIHCVQCFIIEHVFDFHCF